MSMHVYEFMAMDIFHINNFGRYNVLVSVLDSTGKPPIGLFQGSLNWVGQYDQCYKIQAERSNISTGETIENNTFTGSYCDISMDTDKALPNITIPKAVSYNSSSTS